MITGLGSGGSWRATHATDRDGFVTIVAGDTADIGFDLTAGAAPVALIGPDQHWLDRTGPWMPERTAGPGQATMRYRARLRVPSDHQAGTHTLHWQARAVRLELSLRILAPVELVTSTAVVRDSVAHVKVRNRSGRVWRPNLNVLCTRDGLELRLLEERVTRGEVGTFELLIQRDPPFRVTAASVELGIARHRPELVFSVVPDRHGRRQPNTWTGLFKPLIGRAPRDVSGRAVRATGDAADHVSSSTQTASGGSPSPAADCSRLARFVA